MASREWGVGEEELEILDKCGSVRIRCRLGFIEDLAPRIEGRHVDVVGVGDVDAVWVRSIGFIRDFEELLYRFALLEALSTKTYVFNPPVPLFTALNKFAALVHLSRAGLPVPETYVTENFLEAYRVGRSLGRFVVKPIRSSFGIGARLFSDADEAATYFSFLLSMSKPVMMQRYIEHRFDCRVLAAGGEVITIAARVCSGDWRCNVSLGGRVVETDQCRGLGHVGVRAVDVLGLVYGGVDIVVDEGTGAFYVLEVNPIVRWRGVSDALGVDVAGELLRRVVVQLKA